MSNIDKAHTKMIRPDTLTPCTVEEWENWKKEEIAKYGKEQYEKYIRSFFPSDFPEEKIKKFL